MLTEALHECTGVKMFVIPLIGVLEAGAEMVHAWNKFLQKFAGAGCGAMQTISLTPKCTLLV